MIDDELRMRPGECPADWLWRCAGAGFVPAIVPSSLDDGTPAVCSGGWAGQPLTMVAHSPRDDARAAVAVFVCVQQRKFAAGINA